MDKVLTEDQVLFLSKSASLDAATKIDIWGEGYTSVNVFSLTPNMEIISMSVNKVSDLSFAKSLTKLRELYIRNNQIDSFDEISNLADCKDLSILWMDGNPISFYPNYRMTVISMLPQLKKLDDAEITDAERKQIMFNELYTPPPPPSSSEPPEPTELQEPSSSELESELQSEGQEVTEVLDNDLQTVLRILPRLSHEELGVVLDHIQELY